MTDGEFRWALTATQGGYRRSAPVMIPVTDFQLSVEARQVNGPRDGDYGVVFRQLDGNDFYYFGINDAPQYAWFVLYNNVWTTLTDWTRTSAILRGETNRISVSAEGTHFQSFINGQLAAERDDDYLSHGLAGLAVGLQSAGDRSTFAFDNIEVRAP